MGEKTSKPADETAENAERVRKGRFGEQPQPNDETEEGEREKDAVEDALVKSSVLHRPPG